MKEILDEGATQKLVPVQFPIPRSEPSVDESPGLLLPSDVAPATQTPQKQVKKGKRARPQPVNKHDVAIAEMLRERCRQLCLATFFREHAPVRSLGFTSSIAGEGKSFLSAITAQILAEDSTTPVTLLECNWAHPHLHEYFGFTPTPGFAEWLREECSETAIRHQVGHNLTVIPAGDGKQGAMKLLQKVQQNGFLNTLACSNELLIVELPAIVTTGYGSLAARLVESIIIVVRAGITPDGMIAETCAQLKDLPVDGIVLNQIQSRIPRWIRRIM
jgi:protein-tyrosine kinase